MLSIKKKQKKTSLTTSSGNSPISLNSDKCNPKPTPRSSFSAWQDLSLDTQRLASTGISVQPHVRPYITAVFVHQYTSVSEPIRKLQRRFIQAHQYQCKTDYDSSVFIALLFLLLPSRSFTPHTPLFSHTLLLLFQAHNVSSRVLLPVVTWAPFWFTADLYRCSAHGRKVSGGNKGSACSCKSVFARGRAWIPQSQMQLFQQFDAEGLS